MLSQEEEKFSSRTSLKVILTGQVHSRVVPVIGCVSEFVISYPDIAPIVLAHTKIIMCTHIAYL